jgi:hypothetical protein
MKKHEGDKRFETSFKQRDKCSFIHLFVTRSDEVDMKNVQGTRRKVLFLAGLIAIGIILGSLVLYVIDSKGITDTWEYEFKDGRIILDAEDREHLKEQAIAVTLEDEEIKELIAGKDYTTQATLTGNVTVEDIMDVIMNQTERQIVAEGDVNLIVVVTVTFADGSGYNIPVDWQNWTIGEPEFAQQVTPPVDEFRIGRLPELDEGRTRVLP